jgi:hypothetical protein
MEDYPEYPKRFKNFSRAIILVRGKDVKICQYQPSYEHAPGKKRVKFQRNSSHGCEKPWHDPECLFPSVGRGLHTDIKERS